MFNSEDFKIEIENLLLGQKKIDYGVGYWATVTKGIEILFKYRDTIQPKEEYIEKYIEIQNDILCNTNKSYVEDLSDELWAILTRSYPMPDFWNASLNDFKSHVNFREYFTC